MKKFFASIILIVAIAGIFFAVSGKSPQVFRDNIFHSVLTKFITPSEKFWVHRCNSVEKVKIAAEKFSGVEIDANFYPAESFGRKFDISHDSQEAVNFALEKFMPIFAETDTKIWFDFKNLSEENSAESLNELENLLQKYNIEKSRLIVENHNFHALKTFHDAGFYTSFYVTVNEKILNSPEMQDNFRQEVQDAVNSGFVNAVSFPVEYYELVKNCGVNADLLTWNTHNERWWTFLRKSELRKIVEDTQVKVILIVMKTDYDRF